MLESPEIDDIRMSVMLDLAKERSRALGQRRHRRHAAAGVVGLVLVLGTAGAVVVRPAQGGRANQQASNEPHPRVISTWKLVGDATQPSWREPASDGYSAGYGVVCPTATTCFLEESQASMPSLRLRPIPGNAPPVTSVEVTQDGGAIWQQLSLPPGTGTSTGLDCIDANTCVAGGYDSADDAVFLTTDDGGQSWTSLPGLPLASFQFETVSCTTAASCIATGEAAPTVGGLLTTYSLTTTDGGEMWSYAELPAGFLPAAAQCFASGSCIAVGAQIPTPPGPPAGAGEALYSTDAGATWTAVTVPDTTGLVSALSCTDSDDCIGTTFGVNATSQLVVTADGGQTWSLLAADGLPPSFLSGTTCPTSSYCWAGGILDPPGDTVPLDYMTAQGILATTTDGGQTFRTAPLPSGLNLHGIQTVTCPTANQCFALAWQQAPSQQGQFVLLSDGS